MRARTSASQAWGSISFILAEMIRPYRIAARWPPRSLPANSHAFLLCESIHSRNYAQPSIMATLGLTSALAVRDWETFDGIRPESHFA
jgi:hypothetical protein